MFTGACHFFGMLPTGNKLCLQATLVFLDLRQPLLDFSKRQRKAIEDSLGFVTGLHHRTGRRLDFCFALRTGPKFGLYSSHIVGRQAIVFSRDPSRFGCLLLQQCDRSSNGLFLLSKQSSLCLLGLVQCFLGIAACLKGALARFAERQDLGGGHFIA